MELILIILFWLVLIGAALTLGQMIIGLVIMAAMYIMAGIVFILSEVVKFIKRGLGK